MREPRVPMETSARKPDKPASTDSIVAMNSTPAGHFGLAPTISSMNGAAIAVQTRWAAPVQQLIDQFALSKGNPVFRFPGLVCRRQPGKKAFVRAA
jgi:hypothetical protein